MDNPKPIWIPYKEYLAQKNYLKNLNQKYYKKCAISFGTTLAMKAMKNGNYKIKTK